MNRPRGYHGGGGLPGQPAGLAEGGMSMTALALALAEWADGLQPAPGDL